MKLICMIRYKKDGKTESIRLITSIASEWKDVARQLDCDEAKITTYQRAHPGEPKESADAMLSSWTANSANATWARLIQALEDASERLAVQAKEFKYALLNKVE